MGDCKDGKDRLSEDEPTDVEMRPAGREECCKHSKGQLIEYNNNDVESVLAGGGDIVSQP